MQSDTVPQIKITTNVPTPTIKRTLKSEIIRHNKNLTSEPVEKVNAYDLQNLIRAITNSADDKRESYIQLIKDLKISASETTLRKYLRKTNFKRCIACPKPLIS